MTRPKHRRAKRSSHDSPASDAGNDGEGWAIANWFGGLPAAHDASGHPSDTGGSGGGGD